MSCQLLIHELVELPDPSDVLLQNAAGGDVGAAAGACSAQFLRSVAGLPQGAVTTAVRYVFCPQPENGDPQSRLRIYFLATVREQSLVKTVRALIERGPHNHFFNLRVVSAMPEPDPRVTACCTVTRREAAMPRLLPNDHCGGDIPVYYMVQCFEPRKRSDSFTIDGVLSSLEEAASLEICVEPTDADCEKMGHARYLAQLRAVNRNREHDRAEASIEADYVSDLRGDDLQTANVIEPPHRDDQMAEEVLRNQQRVHQALQCPQLVFHIRARAESPETAHLLASVAAESFFGNGSYGIGNASLDSSPASTSDEGQTIMRVCPVRSHPCLFDGPARAYYRELERMGSLASVEELSSAFCLPVAGVASPRSIRRNTDPQFQSDNAGLLIGHDAGLDASENAVRRSIPLSNLSKHMFVSGTPGSGKTTFLFHVQRSLHSAGIPVLALEFAKTDFRSLKRLKEHPDPRVRRLARELQVFTPGMDAISPFRINPLRLKPGTEPEQLIEALLGCLRDSVPLPGPLPALLAEALEQILNAHAELEHPARLHDLIAVAVQVLLSKGYAPEVHSNLRGAIDVRLSRLTRRAVGRIFQCPENVPEIGSLLSGHTIIELAHLRDELPCLLALFLLSMIREGIQSLPVVDGLRLVIIIDEAHAIVGRSGPVVRSEEHADPRGAASQEICRMLAELRGDGVGVVIADQLPSAVAPEVIKQTATKIAFRQVAGDDREQLGATMLFTATELEQIARLSPGTAYLYTEQYHRSQLICTPNLHDELDLSPLPDAQLREYLQDETFFQNAALARAAAELGQLCREMDELDRARERMVGPIARLVAAHARAVALPDAARRRASLQRLIRSVYAQRDRLSESLTTFVRTAYRPLLPHADYPVSDPAVISARTKLERRFRTVIEKDTEVLLQRLHDLIQRCIKSESTC